VHVTASTVVVRPALLRPSRPSLIALGLSAALLALGLAAAQPFLGAVPFLPAPQLPWWALAVLFAVAESSAMFVQKKREAQSASLSEVPLTLGLFLASPVALIVGRVVGLALLNVVRRRTPVLKTTFNLSLMVGETGAAVAVFAAVTALGDGPGPVSWVAALAAAFVSNVVGGIAIQTVIAAHDGSEGVRGMLQRAAQGQLTTPIGVIIGLIAVVSLTQSLQSVWLLVGLGAVVLAGYRAYGGLLDRHRNLERLYGFSRALSGTPDLDGVMAHVLEEARGLLHGERASAAFVDPDGGIIARVRLVGDTVSRDEQPATEPDAWLLAQVVGSETAVLLSRTARGDARRWLDLYGLRDAVVVPLRGGDRAIGALVVADRLGDVRTFETADLQLLETVANHAGVALQNGRLVDMLRHEALHDALTGLPNRVALQRRLTTALEEVADGTSTGAAVMILDLDDFKEVNETLGHEQGDLLLTEVGARLSATVGTGATVARLGGDEFAVLLTGRADEERAVQVGRRLLRSLEQPILLDGLEVAVSGSLGIALAPAHAADTAALLKRADMAMYDAKTSARRLRVFEPELDTDNPRRLTLVAELRSALQHGELIVHVQPKTRLGSGEVAGVEALARWRHPTLGDIPPDEFIPVAERSGLIGPLTTRVLDATLAGYAQWRAAGHDLGVAVNLSARSLHDPDLVEEVGRLLRRHDVPPSRLTLEVTESAVMTDPARAVALLHQLRDLGVRLSVDDFGTGYSSLSYLKRLPVHEVKIDRSFVTTLGRDAEDLPIVRAIVDLGRHMGLEVVAEGVEDARTLDLLDSIGCDLAQGWHLSRPLPLDGLLPWLRGRQQSGRGRGPLRAV
jgi:diguanylate cyclase (GGDEF)-like protein